MSLNVVRSRITSIFSKSNNNRRFLEYGIVGALTGATAATGYATYAYTTDEIEEKTKALRDAVNYSVSDDASAADVNQNKSFAFKMGFTEPTSEKLLPDQKHIFTLVLDLDETLVVSYYLNYKGMCTFKRPGVDAFLEHMAKFYEIVVYSDQLNTYVDPVCDRLDKNHCIRFRLSRGATKRQGWKHYRDLSKLNRDPAKILYMLFAIIRLISEKCYNNLMKEKISRKSSLNVLKIIKGGCLNKGSKAVSGALVSVCISRKASMRQTCQVTRSFFR